MYNDPRNTENAEIKEVVYLTEDFEISEYEEDDKFTKVTLEDGTVIFLVNDEDIEAEEEL